MYKPWWDMDDIERPLAQAKRSEADREPLLTWNEAYLLRYLHVDGGVQRSLS
jgi:hypothetical protein